tara:strand:- start:111 stop:410 length:300 start_codon:yes stop_codon:yes gene_type:complete
MTVPEINHIEVNQNDIFNFVIGKDRYDPIEKCIDCSIYEVFDEFIYNNDTKETINQEEDYTIFCKQVSNLKCKAKNMQYDEIIRICEELEEIAPKYIKL